MTQELKLQMAALFGRSSLIIAAGDALASYQELVSRLASENKQQEEKIAALTEEVKRLSAGQTGGKQIVQQSSVQPQ
jgi:hypothetical protein